MGKIFGGMIVTKDVKEWLNIFAFLTGVSGLGILWWQTNGFIALAVFLLTFSQNVHDALNK